MKTTKKENHTLTSDLAILVTTIQKLSLARNINEITAIVRAVARELTGADGATFVLKDGDLCHYADEDAISPLWKGQKFPLETCISGWVMLNKEPAYIQDIYQDERIPHEAYRPTFVKSLAMVPIRTLDPIGAIGNYWAEHHQPTTEETALLQALADITAVSIENITVRNKMNEKLIERSQMLSQLKKQKKQLEEFTQIISHNMRAPLTNLLLLNDLIETTDKVDDKLIFLSKQKPVINFLNKTFEELVHANQVRMDFSVKKGTINLEEEFMKTIELLQGDVLKTNAQITYNFDKTKSIYYSRKYIESIFFNLLSNSLKYHSPDRTPIIHIETVKKGQWIYLIEKDNGLGIDLEKHGNKLFGLQKTFHKHPEARG